ncbi:MAG: tetraacyldisaccharide 4'-kinase [Rhizobiales bacterium]|nr:tetraacyldisaccharide 4'-kinase [Hyphomicrobiales bacterium]
MWRPPHFWSAPETTIAAALLSPIAAIYAVASSLRFALATPAKVPLPVICVGNPGMGGAGKTPTAIAIAKRLAANGATPHFLTRGYGGKLRGPVQVDPARHSSIDVGDEPLLLAKVAPTHVARDRAAGAYHAVDAGAGCIIMDDGFQNPTLAKDCSLLVIDGAAGIGNGWVFPSGPLREPLLPQLARAEAVLVIGSGHPGEAVSQTAARANVPVVKGQLRVGKNAPDLDGRPVIAFCGIARPEKFFASLEDFGAEIAAKITFDDHHPYLRRDVARIIELAARHDGAAVVTTEKDLVRLDDTNDPGAALRSELQILPIEVVFAETEPLDALLNAAMRAKL